MCIRDRFNPEADIPQWAQEKTNATLFLEDSFKDDVESWDFFSSTSNHQGRIDTLASDSSSVLIIESITTEGSSANSSRWRHPITKPDLPETATLKLTATVSGEEITGQGVSVVLRTDSGVGTNRIVSGFGTTEGEVLITGTFDKQDFSTEIDYVPTDIEDLFVFLLLLPETEGKVTFHDVKLTVLE